MSKEEKLFRKNCEVCDVAMEIKGKWVSKTGMTVSLYQCPRCKNVELWLSGE